MTRERSDLDLGGVLGAWMNDAAPASIPVLVLEEAFARTMSSRQVRVYPWQRVAGRRARPGGLTGFALSATAGVLVAVLAFGAFGGGFGMTPAPSPTPSPTPTATPVPSGSPSPSPPALVPVPIAPTASVGVGRPQSLASDGTAVWVLTETGVVRRIDPATNTLGTAISTGATTDAYQGISAAANGVWVTEFNTATLFRIDPATSKVVNTMKVGLAPKGVLASGTAVWVADVHDGKVFRVNLATNAIVATITVGPTGNSGPNWLASGLGSIWVDIPNDHSVVRIDAITNAIRATIPIPNEATPCGGFAVTPTAVWNMPCDGPQVMTRIDPATNTVVATLELDRRGYNPAVIDGVPWVSIFTGESGPGRLGRMSSSTNAVDLELAPGPTFGGGGDMVIAAGSVWVIDGGNDRVLRLPLTGFTPS
jgi:DNA-binding beta-propeller fold protein YncE